MIRATNLLVLQNGVETALGCVITGKETLFCRPCRTHNPWSGGKHMDNLGARTTPWCVTVP